jgi:hypothetical protein
MTKKNEQFGNDYRDDDFKYRDDDDHRSDNDHKRDDGNDDHYVHRDDTLIAAAQDPSHPGFMYFGNGNFASGYEIADNSKEHIELGMKVHERGGTGADSPVVSDLNNIAHFQEDAGYTTTTNPTTHVVSNRADWNFDYSVDTKLDGGHATLDQFQFKMTISDTNTAENLHHTETFDLNSTTHVWTSESNSAHHFGGDDFTHPATADIMATQAQNSVNIGFDAFNGFGSLADRTSAGTQWDVTLTALEHHEVVAQVHNVINLVPHDVLMA